MIKKISKMLRGLKPLDRRKHPRFDFNQNIPCICVFVKSGQQIEFPAWFCNVSKSGFLITSGENKVFPGTLLTVNFHLPLRQEMFSVSGKVIRTYRRRAEYYYYSGGRFIDPDEPGVKALLDFVEGKGR